MRRAVGYISLLGIAILLLSGFQQNEVIVARRRAAASATPTWALVQHPINAACAAGLTCSVTLTQSFGTGNLILVWAGYNATVAHTIDTISAGGTLTTCPACAALDGNNRGAISYNLSSSSGAGPVTITLSAGSNPTGTWQAEILELSCSTCSSKTLDSGATPSANRDQSTVSTAPAGVTLAIAGATDAIIQTNFSLGVVTAAPNCMSAGSLTAGWTCDAPGGDGFGWLLNTSIIATPTWAQTSAKAALSAIAFTANP